MLSNNYCIFLLFIAGLASTIRPGGTKGKLDVLHMLHEQLNEQLHTLLV